MAVKLSGDSFTPHCETLWLASLEGSNLVLKQHKLHLCMQSMHVEHVSSNTVSGV